MKFNENGQPRTRHVVLTIVSNRMLIAKKVRKCLRVENDFLVIFTFYLVQTTKIRVSFCYFLIPRFRARSLGCVLVTSNTVTEPYGCEAIQKIKGWGKGTREKRKSLKTGKREFLFTSPFRHKFCNSNNLQFKSQKADGHTVSLQIEK